jgi:hypothetical protein
MAVVPASRPAAAAIAAPITVSDMPIRKMRRRP